MLKKTLWMDGGIELRRRCIISFGAQTCFTPMSLALRYPSLKFNIKLWR